ncbi:ribosome hibernation-promoting factor, HPF/YfiA family [Youngiibacter multivorans]|jgi:putative sigma-54 modulation protein|uniref:Ribosome hibernation promoting factor n=1 Tax=Youngiibacter multivorans TaxID=937251 RepID=A0ABS4G4M8_9CLOT|nr:ribosome-associated translation inhibitor RaiA [Youngiibacter multivorans]MBP1919512.1 putative sigma-54 modulation protein [Youngiibacter multivorans]
MKVSIYAKNIELTQGLKEAVESKLGKLDKYFNQPVEARASLSVIKLNHTFEVTIPFGHVLLRAEESTDDMYKSIDMAQDILERQIRRYKTRIERRQSGESVRFNEAAFNARYEDELKEPRIVKTKKISIKPMDKEEAVLQMELLGHDFYVFEDENGDMGVVYKRKDGNYGLIEKELES